MAKKTEVAIVLVGHLNKNECGKDIHRGFGTADIATAVRSIIMEEMSKSDREKRWVRVIKSNFDESDYTPIRLVLDEERRLSFSEIEESNDAKTKIEIAMEIISELVEDGFRPVSKSKRYALKKA